MSEHVRAAIRRTVVAAGATRLVVACSGGADSVCLAHATAQVANERGWSLTIAHIRHGVRPHDAADAQHVEGLAAQLGVPFRLRELTYGAEGPPTKNIEASMRTARYHALAAIAAEQGAEAVLIGHTQGDQAETVLLHLLRGAGSDGLAGMAQAAHFSMRDAPHALVLLRPLLTIERAETEAYCTAHQLAFVHDASNDDDRFTRNWLRHRIVPVLRERYPAVSAALGRTADLIAAEADYLDRQSHAAYCDCVRFEGPGITVIDASSFAAMHVALQRRILRGIIEQHSGEAAGRSHVEALRLAALSTSTTIGHVGILACCHAYDEILVGSVDAVQQRVRILAGTRHPLVQDDLPVTVGEWLTIPSAVGATAYRLAVVRPDGAIPHGGVHQVRYLRLPMRAALRLRPRHPGDRFHAPGHSHAMPLKEYFMLHRIPAPVRDQVPLLIVGDAICWVIGYDTASPFAANAATATHVAALMTDEAPGEEGEREKRG